MSALFSSYSLKSVTLRNRIGVPPMCQYRAEEGLVNDWHLSHYASLARGGAGLVVVEATAVAPEGRISSGCTGLWSEQHAKAMAPIAAAIRAAGAVPGIQIAHAGRKASANRPWEGDDHMAIEDPRSWETISPSALAFGGGLSRVPREMTLDDIARVQADFVAAARRALEAGFEWLELHFAHGYLGQSFMSRHANHRTDEYGGSFANRSRYLLETLRAVRSVWPQHLPLTARYGVIEYDGHDEETMAESVELARLFREEGLDHLSVSVGFSTPDSQIPWGPAFLAPVAERIRREAEISVSSAWGFQDPAVADAAIAAGQLDLALIGRAHLANPHWPYVAAQALGEDNPAWVLPAPYAHWLSRYQG
jgi:2,4-dienoyl-CoA reductase-like NADH-dependent reductase (Old Yellow Enzyme family)